MKNNFKVVMSRKTDAELIQMLSDSPDKYQVAALEAAEREFENRKLSSDEIKVANRKIEHAKQIKDMKANTPLDDKYKIMTFLIPGVLPILFSLIFKANGYDKKTKDFVRWTIYGFLFYFCFAAFLIVYAKLF